MTQPPRGPWRLLRDALGVVLGPDNPFLLLAARQTRRRGEPLHWLPAAMLAGVAALIWFRYGAMIDAGPFPSARWVLLIGAHTALVAAATAVPAWRMMADAQHVGNATALRLSRLSPLECIAGKAMGPLGTGLRTVLCGWPIYLVVALLPGPTPPALAGVAAVLLWVVLYTLFLAAAGGAAAVRSRRATVDDWTDFLFNVRTLATWFLNPAWVFLTVLIFGRAAMDLAQTMVSQRAWFYHGLPGALLFVPVALWCWRQAAGLATEIYGEGPTLARWVVLGLGAAYVCLALLVVGFNWDLGFAHLALATWWELVPTRENSGHLLLALLIGAAYPLPIMAAYAAMLACGLRSGTADGDERLPAFGRSLARLVAAVAPTLMLPWLVFYCCLWLGRWPLSLLYAPVVQKLLALQLLAATLGVLTVLLLALSSRFPRATREVTALAVMLPPLVGPFLLRSKQPLAHALASLSPVTSLLHLLPEAGSGHGFTGDLPVPPLAWVLAGHGGLAVVLLVTAALVVRHDPRPSRSSGGAAFGRWGASETRPLLSVDLLLLKRRGWLYSPLVMAVMPALAMAYVHIHTAVEHMMRDLCALFVWCRTVQPDDPGALLISVVMGSIGAQLFLHPGGLAGLRSFGRERAAGRLDELFMTPIDCRQMVRDRYQSVVSPFVVFVAVTAGPVLALGWAVGQVPMAVAGLLHWVALVLLLPALVLATTVAADWRGQGVLLLLALEVGRIELSQHGLDTLGVNAGMLVANGLLLALALPATWFALRLAVRRLQRLRAGA